jgi:hypothetical protein
LLALVAFISITLGGTPIYKATLTWEAAAPPEGWRAMINRWQRLDSSAPAAKKRANAATAAQVRAVPEYGA